MPRDDDQGPPTRPQREYMGRSITSLFVALDEVHAEFPSVSERSRQQLQSELASLIVQLRQYRNMDNVDWKSKTPFEGGPDQFLKKIRDGTIRETVPEGTHNAKPEPARAPAQIDIDVLYQSALDMIDLTKDLGLAAEVDDSKDTVYPDPV